MIESKDVCLCAGSGGREMGLIAKWENIQTKSEHSLETHINSYPKESQGRILNFKTISKCWNPLYVLDGKHNFKDCKIAKPNG